MGFLSANLPVYAVLQEPASYIQVPPPIEGSSPANVSGMLTLTQALSGLYDNGSYITRGYINPTPAIVPPYTDQAPATVAG